jgi:hypothetical protein
MTPLLLALNAARAWPGGSPICNAETFRLPGGNYGAVEDGAVPKLECTLNGCTLSSSRPFKGFLLGVDGGFLGFDANDAKKVVSNPDCVTHIGKDKKFEISVTLQPLLVVRTVRALVVYERQVGGNAHVYQAVEALVPAETVDDTESPIIIVGGGPGGLGAARYLDLLKRKYVLYEQGENIPDPFWSEMLADVEGVFDGTADRYKTFAPLGAAGPTLGIGLGGTQNVNGAVFAPGTAADLAKSLGVSVPQAKQAQEFVDGWVEHDDNVERPDSVDVAMMWAPLDNADPDYATLYIFNQKMARRSIAYDKKTQTTFTPTPGVGEIKFRKKVERVTETTFEIDDGTIVEHSGIILAAGALSSPQLLGKTEFEVTNHGYLDSGLPDGVEKHTFTYSENFDEETMRAEGYADTVEIKMFMTTAYKQTATVGVGITEIKGGIKDPWHYMNTVDHTGMRVTGYNNVYIGDASALKVPFNCHTSMPAAAAGVLAAQALLGANLAPPKNVEASYATRARLFLAGLWVLGTGVTAHIVGSVYRKRTGKPPPSILGYVHYVCQPTGTVLVTVAAAWAAALRDPSAATGAHRILGWIVIGLLWANVFGGAYFKYQSLTDKNYNEETGKPHRITGYVITTLLMALAFTATVAGTGIDKNANAAAFAGILGLMLLLTFLPAKNEPVYSSVT